jgi:branched-chain amino acid transport system ATP-binding protein
MDAALEVIGVRAGYERTEVLREISLVVPAGAVVALLGANGAGKSTTLKTISGLVRPTAGTVRMFGDDITNESTAKRANRGLCHIPEGRSVFRSLTVRENLELQAPSGSESDAIALAIESFPVLGRRINQQAGTLSGGEQQMLAMARAYTRRPRLVLVDEASLGLAPLIVDQIFAFLVSITGQGASLLIVDQFVARALEMASHAYVLNRGVITFDGSADELRQGDVFERYLGGTAADVEHVTADLIAGEAP